MVLFYFYVFIVLFLFLYFSKPPPMSHEYDDTGYATSYVLLSFFLPSTIAALIYSLRHVSAPPKCSCPHCPPVKRRKFHLFLTAFLVSITAILLRNVIEISPGEVKTPLSILGLDPSDKLTPKKIHAAFRNKIKEYNPKRVVEEEKENMNKKMQECIDAFNTLKNAKGNVPTPVTKEVIAIPTKIIEHSPLLLLLYFVAIICVPRFVLKSWKNSCKINRCGTEYSTADDFFTRADLRDPRNLIAYIGNSIGTKSSTKLKQSVKNFIEDRFGYPLRDTDKMNEGYFVLMDHLFRTNIYDKKTSERVVDAAIRACASFKAIAFAKDDIPLIDSIYTCERMIIQGVFEEDFQGLQNPWTDFDTLFAAKHGLKTSVPPVFQLPSLKLSGLSCVSPESVIVNSIIELPRCSQITVGVTVKTTGSQFVHCPFVGRTMQMLWVVYCELNGIFSEENHIVEAGVEKELTFKVDSYDESKGVIRVIAKSGCYFGIDREETMNVKFVGKSVEKVEEEKAEESVK